MVEWIVSSSVLILVVILLRFILKGRINLRLQYALWALVLIRLLLPVSFGDTALSIQNLTQRAASSESMQFVSALSEIELPKMSYRAAYDEVAEEYAARGIQIAEMPLEQYAETVDYEIMDKMRGEFSIVEIMRLVWLFGTALVGIWFAISNLRLLDKLKKDRSLLECDGELPVYLSDAVETPCLFGLFRPTIYLTDEAIENEQARHHAIKHELTHYHHRDNIWAILRCLCLAVHWFNPLVWYAAVLSRNDAELACDESTILRLGEAERADYGRTLLRLTCEKRPALLNTATTMTSSGKSIKERIRLIAKKPKMTVYTLIAVVLIAAIAVGCTFTGAEEKSVDYNDDWFITEAWPLAKEYADANGLNISKNSVTVIRNADDTWADVPFTETEGLRSVQVSFVKNDNGEWAVVPVNAVNLLDPERWGIQASVSDELANSVPAAVLNYARDYVAQLISFYHEAWPEIEDPRDPCRVTKAKITGITQISTGTAGLDDSINMYLLEYRLLVEGNSDSILIGGMNMEDGWLTEWGSAGQPYLLLHREDRGGDAVWTPICVTNTDSIDFDYGTPEMLEKYGSKYTAAAMELYREYRNAEPANAVCQAIDRILVGTRSYDDTWQSAGNYTITVSSADGRTDSYSCVPVTAYSSINTSGYHIGESYDWSPANAWSEDFSNSDYVLTISNDQYSVTVYSNESKIKIKGPEGMAMYLTGTPRTEDEYAAIHEYERMFLELRQYAMRALEAYELEACYVDGTETNYDVIAQKLSEQYSRMILDRPGWYHQRAEDAKFGGANVYDAYYGEDDPNFCFGMGIYLKIPEEQTFYWQAGAGLTEPPADGEFAGYYGYGSGVTVHKSEDGRWRMLGLATGGAWAYLPVATESASVKELVELYFLTSGQSRDWRILSALAERPLDEVKKQVGLLNKSQQQELKAGIFRFMETYPNYHSWSPGDFES